MHNINYPRIEWQFFFSFFVPSSQLLTDRAVFFFRSYRFAGEAVLYCKGADEAILSQLAAENDLTRCTFQHLQEMAEVVLPFQSVFVL